MLDIHYKRIAIIILKLFIFTLYCYMTIGNTAKAFEAVAPDDFEDDDTYSQASVIELDFDTTQRHNFHDAGDQDWAKFYGMAGERYMIETVNLESN